MTSEAKVRALRDLLQMTCDETGERRRAAKRARLLYLGAPTPETREAAAEAAVALLDAEASQAATERAYYEAREEAGLDD